MLQLQRMQRQEGALNACQASGKDVKETDERLNGFLRQEHLERRRAFFPFREHLCTAAFFFRMQVFFLEAVAAMATDKGCTLPNILHSVIVYCFFDFPEPLDLIFHGCRAAPFSVKWHSTSSGKGNSDLQWDV